MALAWTGDELSREQAQNGVNFGFEVKFDLECQGQSPPKTIGILTKVFYTYGPNLVILAWTGDELSRGQTWWRTDGRTQATTIPEGQYWPQVKTIGILTLNMRVPINPSYLDQYHGCWCPDSLHHQDISTHDIDYSLLSNIRRTSNVSVSGVCEAYYISIRCELLYRLGN